MSCSPMEGDKLCSSCNHELDLEELSWLDYRISLHSSRPTFVFLFAGSLVFPLLSLTLCPTLFPSLFPSAPTPSQGGGFVFCSCQKQRGGGGSGYITNSSTYDMTAVQPLRHDSLSAVFLLVLLSVFSSSFSPLPSTNWGCAGKPQEEDLTSEEVTLHLAPIVESDNGAGHLL